MNISRELKKCLQLSLFEEGRGRGRLSQPDLNYLPSFSYLLLPVFEALLLAKNVVMTQLFIVSFGVDHFHW